MHLQLLRDNLTSWASDQDAIADLDDVAAEADHSDLWRFESPRRCGHELHDNLFAIPGQLNCDLRTIAVNLIIYATPKVRCRATWLEASQGLQDFRHSCVECFRHHELLRPF